MAFSLKPGVPLDERVPLCLKDQLQEVDEILSLAAPTKEHFHQARKRLKKARALVRLVRSELGDETYRIENGLYRDVARCFSVVRDAQVLPDTLETLLKHAHRSPSACLYAALERLLEREGKRAAKTLRENRNALQRAQAKLRAGIRRMDTWAFSHSGWKAVEPGLMRVYRQGRRAFECAYRTSTPEAFHEWRKHSKYLRHQLEFVASIWEPALRSNAAELHRLGDFLGEDHDLFMLRQALESLELNDPDLIGELDSLMAHRHAQLRALAEPLGHKLFGEKPRAFGARLKLYWKSSQSSAQNASTALVPSTSQKRQTAAPVT